MEKFDTRPSVYSYVTDMHIQRYKNAVIRDVQPESIPGENLVIQAFYGYRFLTRNLLKKNLEVYGHERLDERKILKRMMERGLIDRFTISKDSPPDLDVYRLSDKAMDSYYGLKPPQADNIPNILESLAISQFHMAVLPDRKVHQYFHNHEEFLGDDILTINSLITITGKPPLYMASTPSPRNATEESLKNFIKKMVLTDDYLHGRSSLFRSYIQTVVCESESQMKEISKLLSRRQETMNILTLYSLDEEGRDGRNPLQRLHNIRWNGEDAEIELINLIR